MTLDTTHYVSINDEPLMFSNNGQELKSTNFWQSKPASRGLMFLTANAGALRLLVPKSREINIADFATGKNVIITKGFLAVINGVSQPTLEIMFEDYSDNPYAIFIAINGQTDNRCCLSSDRRTDIPFTVWIEAGEQLSFIANYRTAATLPYMRGWGE